MRTTRVRVPTALSGAAVAGNVGRMRPSIATAVLLATATTSDISAGLTAIRDDLSTIDKAQADLDDERKSQLRKANEAFEDQVRDLASSLGSTTSLSDAKAQLGDALDQLATAYQDTLATFDCGS